MEEVLLEARGIDGRLVLLRNVVRIQRFGLVGWLTRSSCAERDITISRIRSIRFGRAGWFSRGYMEIIATEEDDRTGDAPASGECLVRFSSRQQRAFEAFRGVLEDRMSGGTARPATAAASDLDELDKLSSLRDRRVITEEEFNQKKRRLLGL